MKTRTLMLALTCALAVTVVGASAQMPPSDSELRSTYCIPLLQANVQATRNLAEQLATQIQAANQKEAQALEGILNIARQEVAADEDAWSRLRAYVAPRASAVQIEGLEAALQRGKVDSTRIQAERERCGQTCGPWQSPGFSACLSACTDKSPLLARLQQCKAPTWLPF